MNNSIAVLITCHNRKNKTITCLNNLFGIKLPSNFKPISVFLVDDGSTDGTTKVVNEQFPEVNVIQGNGNLFWNQGMRLAWESASKHSSFDFFFWLNDDVLLEENALVEMLEIYHELTNNSKIIPIITGAMKESKKISEFSYGGRSELGPIIPNGSIQECKYINGNAVLISKKIFENLGNLSPDYTHGFGDIDYGLRALEAGFNNYTTKTFIGICSVNPPSNWSNPNISLIKRLKLFKSPRGLNYSEYIFFRKKFWKHKWILFALKAYFKVLFPSIYSKLKTVA